MPFVGCWSNRYMYCKGQMSVKRVARVHCCTHLPLGVTSRLALDLAASEGWAPFTLPMETTQQKTTFGRELLQLSTIIPLPYARGP